MNHQLYMIPVWIWSSCAILVSWASWDALYPTMVGWPCPWISHGPTGWPDKEVPCSPVKSWYPSHPKNRLNCRLGIFSAWWIFWLIRLLMPNRLNGVLQHASTTSMSSMSCIPTPQRNCWLVTTGKVSLPTHHQPQHVTRCRSPVIHCNHDPLP